MLQGMVYEVPYLYDLEVLLDNASCYWILEVHNAGLHTYWEDTVLWDHQDDMDLERRGWKAPAVILWGYMHSVMITMKVTSICTIDKMESARI
ncbi:hypothetical protein HanPSC8_Chr10g0410261 [Helianthus annuus]|nr:hypothetical protein HanPSC8_Chr10g0410261 [Helianthus annuus]